MEEGGTDSLQIVDQGEREEVDAASAAAALLPQLLQEKEDEKNEDKDQSADILTTFIQPTSSCQPYIAADAFTVWPQVDLHPATLPVVASGYTTLEMFQQATPQVVPASTQTSMERQQEENEEEDKMPRCSYIRQLSTNSTRLWRLAKVPEAAVLRGDIGSFETTEPDQRWKTVSCTRTDKHARPGFM